MYPLLNLLLKFLNKGQWVTDISKMKFQRIQELVNYELEYLAVCQFKSLVFVVICWYWCNPCFWSFLLPEGAPNYFPNSFTGPLDDLRHSPHTVKVSVDSQKSILVFLSWGVIFLIDSLQAQFMKLIDNVFCFILDHWWCGPIQLCRRW